MPTEIKQGGQGKDKKKKVSQAIRLKKQEKKTTTQVHRIARRAFSKRTRAGMGDHSSEADTRQSRLDENASPGVKARVKNRLRHGQDVPVRSKGKLQAKAGRVDPAPRKKRKG